MSGQSVDVSVVVCAYTEKRWHQLNESINSIKIQTKKPIEIIVVIDHNPGLLEKVKREMREITCVPSSGEQGLSGARNTGIAKARGQFIVFMDEDAAAAADWLEKLIAEYHDPRVLGVGGEIIPLWDVPKPGWFPSEFLWVVGCSYLGLPMYKSRVRNLIGCNMSFRREILVNTGGFRIGIGRVKALPKGCEETELCIRAHQQTPSGFFLYQPEAKVFHHVSRDRISWRYFFARCFSEGLSKAQVSTFVGEREGLKSEWSYSLKTLPGGFWRNLVVGFRNRHTANLLKALAIASGLLITTCGYIIGILFARRNRSYSNMKLKPIESVHYDMEPNSSNNTEAFHY